MCFPGAGGTATPWRRKNSRPEVGLPGQQLHLRIEFIAAQRWQASAFPVMRGLRCSARHCQRIRMVSACTWPIHPGLETANAIAEQIRSARRWLNSVDHVCCCATAHAAKCGPWVERERQSFSCLDARRGFRLTAQLSAVNFRLVRSRDGRVHSGRPGIGRPYSGSNDSYAPSCWARSTMLVETTSKSPGCA
jgi:hypothetical protein